jgi:hypothetical protein
MHHLELKTFTRNTNISLHNIDNNVAKALDDREEQGICACIHWESLGHIASLPTSNLIVKTNPISFCTFYSYEFFFPSPFQLKTFALSPNQSRNIFQDFFLNDSNKDLNCEPSVVKQYQFNLLLKSFGAFISFKQRFLQHSHHI